MNTREDIIELLNLSSIQPLVDEAARVKGEYTSNKVFFRGLMEYSNICSKNCLYCGLGCGNSDVGRYTATHDEVMEAARIVLANNYASMVIQSGERSDRDFVKSITRLVGDIKEMSSGRIGITLSCGEQSRETYKEWFDAGAHRYLLRIESSNEELYYKIHPNNAAHSFKNRLDALYTLRGLNYQVGTGVMIGLPFQTVEILANDLMFFKNFDVDMVGIGPYIEHHNTPLYAYRNLIPSKEERLKMTLKMIAILRIMMKDINIAATTAMQTLDPNGREMALQAGANVVMPNLTPLKYREGYAIYDNKPSLNEDAEETKAKLEKKISDDGNVIGFGEWGDSIHFKRKQR